MDQPRVLGLDLSVTASGVARDDGATETIKPKRQGDQRLTEIRKIVGDVTGGAELVVIEDFVVRSAASSITGMVHGAVRELLLSRGIPYAVIAPATLKAFATGKGNGDKTAMAMAAYKRAEREFADDNQCDAWWLRQAGLHHLGRPEFSLPADQVARLDKVAWPALPKAVA
ncbi:hypothetical protein [Streptomonospora arabica]|uniref:Holliday junction nuclease RuvC n=1 Tax=Streptomonospora arabica TaxID=412417 RepID=A0ABV9SSF4_9ACTN